MLLAVVCIAVLVLTGVVFDDVDSSLYDSRLLPSSKLHVMSMCRTCSY